MPNPESEVVAAGTVLAGRYRVERQLGQGGMGSVYLVQHLHTEQQLALKLLHAAVVQDELTLTRFRREARATARVDSDHVVKITDADVAPELGDVPFLVMEWLRGESLEDRAAARGPLAPAEVVLYLRQVARALDKAHAAGIVHRDLKPENLFLTTREDGTACVKVLDFGIAKLTEGSEDPARLKATGTGQIFGTPLYMSPEQIKAELDRISPRSDVWALGIVAHRLLLGAEPWTATTITGLVAQIAYEPMPVPSKSRPALGPAFDTWFARCCARDIEARFPSAGEAVAALAEALRVGAEVTGEVPAPAPSVIPSARPSGPRREEMGQTAFSATAPASSLPATRSVPTHRRSPTLVQLALGGAAIAVVAGVASWAWVQSRRPAVVTVTASPPPPTPSVQAAPPAAPAEPTGITVTPLPSAPTPSAAPAAASARPAVAIHKPSLPALAVPSPPPPPSLPPPPPPPAKVDDPLGTRH